MNEARPFEEYKDMIQDMSKEEMIKGLYDLSKNNIEKEQEIERLKEEKKKVIDYIKYSLNNPMCYEREALKHSLELLEVVEDENE